MNQKRLHIPRSAVAQVAELHRIASADDPHSIRIFELAPRPNPYAEHYARQYAELRTFRRHVLRSLWIAFGLLSVCFILAVVHHGGWLLLALLWLLDTSCVPLLLMVSQDIREAR